MNNDIWKTNGIRVGLAVNFLDVLISSYRYMVEHWLPIRHTRLLSFFFFFSSFHFILNGSSMRLKVTTVLNTVHLCLPDSMSLCTSPENVQEAVLRGLSESVNPFRIRGRFEEHGFQVLLWFAICGAERGFQR